MTRLLLVLAALFATGAGPASAAINAPTMGTAWMDPETGEAQIQFTVADAPDRVLSVSAYRGTTCDDTTTLAAAKTVKTDASGNAADAHYITVAEGVAVTLTAADGPDSSTASACAIVTKVPKVSFSKVQYAADEGAGAARVTISRSANSPPGAVRLQLQQRDTTFLGVEPRAVDADREAGPVAATLPEGVASVDVDWKITDDAVDEPDEQFALLITSPDAFVEGHSSNPDGFGVVTIVDNDPTPTSGGTGGTGDPGDSGGTGGTADTVGSGSGTGTTGTTTAATSKLKALKPVKAKRAITISGTVTGSAKGVAVAIVQYTPKTRTCRFVRLNGKLGTARKVRTLAECASRGYVPATLGATFKRTLARGLPKGMYTVLSQARSQDGTFESMPSTSRGNRATLKVT